MSLIRLLKTSSREFQRCFLLAMLSLVTINLAILLILHPRVDPFDYRFPSHYQRLLLIESALFDTKVTKARKMGIGSIYFRSMAHKHNVSSECYAVASNAVLEEWRNGNQTVCSIGSTDSEKRNVLIQEYVLKSWEYEPTFVRYHNVEAYWGRDILPMGCPDNTTLRHEYWGPLLQVKPPWLGKVNPSTTDESEIIQIYDTVIQVGMFEQHNPYERFHAMLNAAMVMRMFDIENPQLVLLLNEDNKDKMTNNTLDMWKSFSTAEPILVDIQNPRSRQEKVKRFHDLIHLSYSGTSIMTTKSGVLKGRGTDHHCKSKLFRDIVQWMAMNYNIEIIHTKDTEVEGVIQIVWSSRRKQQYGIVKRTWHDEDRLLDAIRNALGPTYNVTAIDFGTINTRESIQVVSQIDIMIGVHGAGLTWAAFMPMHGGLIEVFGGDRDNRNRHYHNIASLADLHYREISLGSMDPIRYDQDTVKDLAAIIQSVPPRNLQFEPD